VEDDNSKYWKGWGTTDALLDTDEVHPSIKGASILATQVLIDFPEISLE
jgi:lysophospholipase L1-like esterase